MTKIFVALAAIMIALVGVAAAKDSHDRKYLSIQDQYKQDYGTSFDSKAQQLFPSFAQSSVGTTFRVERCISCHVPDISTIGPQLAAKRLVQDFLKYEPNKNQIIAANGLKLVHPALITQELYNAYGADSFATTDGFQPYQVPSDSGNGTTQTVKLAGPIPSFLSPAANGGKALGIDQVGCIACHNGGRLSLDDTAAHTNLIINPEYSFTEGAALYYKNCAVCHGNLGQGKIGPPLNNQDRLGYFNEDYYYRCIEYGYTDFEHVGSVMPVWGAASSDWSYDATRDGPLNDPAKKPIKRALSEDQINILVQFIRHWENYSTLP